MIVGIGKLGEKGKDLNFCKSIFYKSTSTVHLKPYKHTHITNGQYKNNHCC